MIWPISYIVYDYIGFGPNIEQKKNMGTQYKNANSSVSNKASHMNP